MSASYIPIRKKQQEPDVLSALERYLDDLDATLQLKRELMAHVSEQLAQNKIQIDDAQKLKYVCFDWLITSFAFSCSAEIYPGSKES